MGKNINQLTPALAIHPGEIILDEINANGFTQVDFAKMIGMEKSQLNEIIKGKRDVNAEVATLLGAALGIEANYWLNLQNQYNLDKVKIDEKTVVRVESIEIYQEISSWVAQKYLRKQNVLCGDPIKDLPLISEIYGVNDPRQLSTVFDNAQFARFRKSETLQVDKVNLVGWVKYSEYLAKNVEVESFSPDCWSDLKDELRALIHRNQNVHQEAQDILSNYGIKLIYQDKAEKAPIDGIAFWSNSKPSIALTLRHKRLDNFAFTLFHELGHVFLHLVNDESKEVIDLVNNEEQFKQSSEEIEANNFASNNLIPEIEWEKFMSNFTITEDIVYEFADKIGMNPSIILGRICYEMGRYNIKTNISHRIH